MLCRPHIRGHAGYREKIKLKSNSSVSSPSPVRQGERKRLLLRDKGGLGFVWRQEFPPAA